MSNIFEDPDPFDWGAVRTGKPDGASIMESAADEIIAGLRMQVDRQITQLAECYRLTGADPDGNEDWRLAPRAVEEVRRLRAESDQFAADLEHRNKEYRILSDDNETLGERVKTLEDALERISRPNGLSRLQEILKQHRQIAKQALAVQEPKA